MNITVAWLVTHPPPRLDSHGSPRRLVRLRPLDTYVLSANRGLHPSAVRRHTPFPIIPGNHGFGLVLSTRSGGAFASPNDSLPEEDSSRGLRSLLAVQSPIILGSRKSSKTPASQTLQPAMVAVVKGRSVVSRKKSDFSCSFWSKDPKLPRSQGEVGKHKGLSTCQRETALKPKATRSPRLEESHQQVLS
jgi:hypothetical protein